jgi:hypothetical protein
MLWLEVGQGVGKQKAGSVIEEKKPSILTFGKDF